MTILNVKGARKISVILCSFCMILMLYADAITTYAQSTSTAGLTVSSCSEERGKTVDVSFQLSGNPGIWGMKFKVDYNHEVMTLKSVKVGDVFTGSEVTLPESLNKEQFVFCASADKLENISTDGTLVVLSFLISNDAAYADYPVTVDMTQVINVDSNDVNIAATDGKVTVKDGSGEQPSENETTAENQTTVENQTTAGEESTSKTQTDSTEKETSAMLKEPVKVGTNDRLVPIIIAMVCVAGGACILFMKYYEKGR